MYISDCMTAKEIRIAMPDDEHIGMLSELILHGWPSTKIEVQKHLQPCWSFKDENASIGGIAMKGRRIVILVVLFENPLK